MLTSLPQKIYLGGQGKDGVDEAWGLMAGPNDFNDFLRGHLVPRTRTQPTDPLSLAVVREMEALAEEIPI